ncbi:MAG: DUF1501 domain-containing protein [Planctomycetales bacterium]|nr:DUF1501 domain-containing protein [Planctomycetales bacterium]
MGTTACRNFRRSSSLTRRELLRLGGLPLFGLSLSNLVAGRAMAKEEPGPRVASANSFGKAKRCIFLFMWGGPSQLETWDLKPEAPSEVRGEFQPIKTKVPGIHISEHFPRLAQRTDKLCIVRSMTHTDVNHTSATHFLLTGQPPPPTTEKSMQWPHIGATLSALGRGTGPLPALLQLRPKVPGDVPRFVEQSQGQFAGWLGAAHDPMTIDADANRDDYSVPSMELLPEIAISRLEDRWKLLQDLNKQLAAKAPLLDAKEANCRKAFEILSSGVSGQGVFDLDQEPGSLRDRYGRNPHGQSVLQARRLVERGVPLVTVFWPNDGIKNVSVYWDTHSRNFIDHKERLMPVADQAFSTLLDDLEERGMLDDTLVVWTGEFGRTPKVGQRNSDAGAGADGRDHWPGCFSTVLAGGGFKQGFVYGRSDKRAAYPDENPVAPKDLVATIYHALGVPEQQILRDVNGRPHFVRPGSTIHDLLM